MRLARPHEDLEVEAAAPRRPPVAPMTYDHSKYENRLRASAVLKDLKGKLIDVGVPTIEARTMTAELSMA